MAAARARGTERQREGEKYVKGAGRQGRGEKGSHPKLSGAALFSAGKGQGLEPAQVILPASSPGTTQLRKGVPRAQWGKRRNNHTGLMM